MTSLGTASSMASLPVNISCAVERNQISQDIASFVLSLGATINMDGTAIVLICATWFLGAIHGVTMGVSKIALTIMLATLCSMGASPIPSSGPILLLTICTAVGVPVDEAVGLVTAVDWIMDRFAT